MFLCCASWQPFWRVLGLIWLRLWCIELCFNSPPPATAFADLNESGVCNTGQVMPNDIIHLVSTAIINFLSLLTDGESSASANTLRNIMSLTICAFKIELPTRRRAVMAHIETGWVKMWDFFLAKSKNPIIIICSGHIITTKISKWLVRDLQQRMPVHVEN